MSRTYCMKVEDWAREYDGPPFHALLCDPPYHLQSIVDRFGDTSMDDDTQTSEDARNRSTPYARGSVGFMGQEWDGGDVAFRKETWKALADHLYPGAFGMAYAAARNYHRLACAIEDAGMIIHPMIGWVYSSGFPKATNISKALRRSGAFMVTPFGKGTWDGHRYGLQALKPALEPIVVFQKPYGKGIKPLESIVRTGAGALNIDAGRIPSDAAYTINTWDDNAHPFGEGAGNEYTGRQENSRWPANFLVGDEQSAEMLDKQSGQSKTKRCENPSDCGGNTWGGTFQTNRGPRGYTDEGGASRFFYNVQEQLDEGDPICYCKKANTKEREAGLEDFEPQEVKTHNESAPDDGGNSHNTTGQHPAVRRNNHPTVKPIDLSRYLASLLLPPIQYAPRRILVPFAGVHSEAIGALMAGWEEIIAIEMTERYCELGKARVRYWKGRMK